MKRMAILIDSPTVNLAGCDHNTVQAATNSIKYWNYYLKTPKLGAWVDGEEIQYRSDWNKENLIDFIQSLTGIDYIFFVYCGHGARFPKQGCTNPISGNDFEDYILLNYGRETVRLEEIREEIAKAADKATMLIDACRGNVWQATDSAKPITSPLPPLNEDKNYWRNEWMRTLSDYDSIGVVVIQSCSPGKRTYAYPLLDPEFTLFSHTIFKCIKSAPFSMNVGTMYKNAYENTCFLAQSALMAEQTPTCSHDYENVEYPFILTGGLNRADHYMPSDIQ